jgi:hypothetical protein
MSQQPRRHLAGHRTHSPMPAGFVELPPGLSSPDEIKEWQAYWDELFADDNPHQIRFVPAGPRPGPTPRQRQLKRRTDRMRKHNRGHDGPDPAETAADIYLRLGVITGSEHLATQTAEDGPIIIKAGPEVLDVLDPSKQAGWPAGWTYAFDFAFDPNDGPRTRGLWPTLAWTTDSPRPPFQLDHNRQSGAMQLERGSAATPWAYTIPPGPPKTQPHLCAGSMITGDGTGMCMRGCPCRCHRGRRESAVWRTSIPYAQAMGWPTPGRWRWLCRLCRHESTDPAESADQANTSAASHVTTCRKDPTP